MPGEKRGRKFRPSTPPLPKDDKGRNPRRDDRENNIASLLLLGLNRNQAERLLGRDPLLFTSGPDPSIDPNDWLKVTKGREGVGGDVSVPGTTPKVVSPPSTGYPPGTPPKVAPPPQGPEGYMPPGTPPPVTAPPGVVGDGGLLFRYGPDYQPPEWWQEKYDVKNPYASLTNALLPFLAPDDQNSVRNYLATSYKDIYGGYGKVPIPGVDLSTPDAISKLRSKFYSADRAGAAKMAIDNMLKVTGIKPADMGAGYEFLNRVIASLEKYGGSGGAMSRAQYASFANDINNLLKTAEGDSDLANYIPLARMLAQPTVGGKNLMEIRANKRLFG